MANATTNIMRAEEDEAQLARTQIEQATTENAEGIVEALGLLQDLEERGLLPIVRALIAQGDDVLKIILAVIQREEYTGGLKNLISVMQFFTSIPPDAMTKLFDGVRGGVEEASHAPLDQKVGVYDALKAMRDPDVSRSISFVLTFLKGMGRAIGEASDASSPA